VVRDFHDRQVERSQTIVQNNLKTLGKLVTMLWEKIEKL